MNTTILRLARKRCILQQIHQTSSPRRILANQLLSSTNSYTSPLLRHASTTTQSPSTTRPNSPKPAQTLPKSSTPTTTSRTSKDILNAPLSTLPAPLDLPTKDPSLSTVTYFFRLGKAYANFYKTGVKNIYQNYKLSKPLRQIVNNQYNRSYTYAVEDGALSRADFQLLLRTRHDLVRIPVFALVFLVCGEFTPLVVIALSNVVPWTCRIPRQIDSDRRKLEERRAISFRNLTHIPASNEPFKRMQLLHVSWSLGLSSRMWDWLGGQLPGLPNKILLRRGLRRLEYFRLDDWLIKRDGGVKALSDEEVRMACVERGIDVLGRKVDILRETLECWMKSAEKVDADRLLIVRPNMWPVTPKTSEKETRTKL